MHTCKRHAKNGVNTHGGISRRDACMHTRKRHTKNGVNTHGGISRRDAYMYAWPVHALYSDTHHMSAATVTGS